jgi:hypothetical protein
MKCLCVCVCAWQNVLLVTSRSGIQLYDPESLFAIETGYREPVEQKPFIACDVSPDGRCIVGVSSTKAAQSSTLFFFGRDRAGDMRLKAKTLGCCVCVEGG